MSTFVIALLALVGGVGAVVFSKGRNRLIGVVVAVIGLLGVGKATVVVIDGRQVGIPIAFGKIGQPIGPGAHFVPPWANVTNFSTALQESSMLAIAEGDRKGDDSIEVITKDGATIKIDVTVRYTVDPAKADDLYRLVGGMVDVREKIVRPLTRSGMRDTYGLRTAEEATRSQRGPIALSAADELRPKLEAQGVKLDSLLVREMALDANSRQRLEAIVQQRADNDKATLTRQNEISQAENEVKKAQLAADRLKVDTQAQADKKRVEADAEANANKVVSQSLTPEVLRAREIEALRSAAAAGNTVIYPAGSNPPTVIVNGAGSSGAASTAAAASGGTKP